MSCTDEPKPVRIVFNPYASMSFEYMGLILLRVFLEIMPVEPRAMDSLTASLKYGPGLRAQVHPTSANLR